MSEMENSFHLLLFVMAAISISAFVLTNYDILHPFCIVALLMTFSVFLAILGMSRWNLYMSIDASMVIIGCVLSFGVGSIWSDWTIKRGLSLTQWIYDSEIGYEIKNWKIACAVLFMIGMACFQYKEVYEASIIYGNTSGIFDLSDMIKIVRHAIEMNQLDYSRWYQYRFIFATGIAYCSIYIFFINVFSSQYVGVLKNAKILLPVLFDFPFFILSGGRGGVLELFIFTLIVGAIIYQRVNGFSLSAKKRTILIFLGCGCVSFIIFLLMGIVTGKVVPGRSDPIRILIHYGGLSLPALSKFLDQIHLENSLIGSHTLVGIYNNLNSLGAGLPKVKAFLPFVDFGGINTNVYSIAGRYILDYGFVGMVLLMSILGIFYTAFYDIVRFKMKGMIGIAFYGLVIFPIFFFTNDDFFLSTVVNTAILYKFISFFCVYEFFTLDISNVFK